MGFSVYRDVLETMGLPWPDYGDEAAGTGHVDVDVVLCGDNDRVLADGGRRGCGRGSVLVDAGGERSPAEHRKREF